MTSNISVQQSSDTHLTQGAIFAPPASEALVWRPRFVADTAFVSHLPFCFWLAYLLRPLNVMAVGMTDAVSYFALCQALDKLSVATTCTGVGTWPVTAVDMETKGPTETLPQVPERVQTHNTDHYAMLSKIRWQEATPALTTAAAETLDLLIVNLMADLANPTLFFEQALSKMSTRGVIMIHDLQACQAEPDKAACLQALQDKYPTICFDDGEEGLRVVLTGPDQDDRLADLAALTTGSPAQIAAQALFRQLGAGHSQVWARARAEQTAQTAQTLANQTAAELDMLQDKYSKLMAAYDARSQNMATDQARFYDLQQQVKTLEHQLLKLLKEKDILQAEQEAEKETLANENKTFEFQLQTRFHEMALLQQEIITVEKRARRKVEALKSSTSWRLTAPLRAVIRRIRPGR